MQSKKTPPGLIKRQAELKAAQDNRSGPLIPQIDRIAFARRNLARQELLATGDRDVADPTIGQVLRAKLKLNRDGAKFMHSPDRFEEDAVEKAEPPRLEYHKDPENLNTAERPKVAGLSRGKIQESMGTDSPRSGERTRSAGLPEVPAGSAKAIPSGVQSYNDTGELP